MADPFLPRRLRQLAAIVRGEQRVQRGWFRAMTSWLDLVRPGVLRPSREAGLPPDASAVFDQPGLWQQLVDADVIPEITRLFRNPYTIIAPDSDPDIDPFAIEYLQGVRNRLARIPDEVYALVIRDVERGIREGLSIPEIADAVNQTLTSSGSARWPNRAIVVARTETIGATNGGAFAAAVQRALLEGDASPEKVWISTIDSRTRPTHAVADQQRVPLLQPFTVGGVPLMFPGDPSGPASEVIQCRCSILDVVTGEDLDWTNRQFLGED